MYQVLTLTLSPGKDDREIERQINLQNSLGWTLTQLSVDTPLFGQTKILLVFKKTGSP